MAEPGARFPDYEVELLKVRDFLQNFEDHSRNRVYVNLLEEIADRRRLVLEVELDDVLAFKGEVDFAANIPRNTVRYTHMFEAAVDSLLPARSTSDGEQLDVFDYLMEQRQREQRRHAAPLAMGEGGEGEEAGNETPVVDLPRSLLRRFEVRILPFSAFLPKTIREIRAGDIGALVKITGMVTRSSDVKPQVAVVTYTCEICGSGIFQEVSGSQYMPLTKCSSERCKDNKSYGQLEMQSRGSKFLKYQELKVQELPNQVPVGHIPRCLVVHCHGETTRSCGPGDIVTISGIFLAVRVDGFKAMRSGLQADTYIEASKVEKVKQSYSALDAIDASRKVIDAMAGEEDRYGRLASSIAPEIFGHDDVKKALLLQLVGGATKTLADGMKIRGDINILLMGDPGVAKSQLLKYIASVAPRGVYTTGKGSSGVGLTASVVRDNISGEMALEGGALVMADRGICCIDEFDKMEDGDRTAIHEVMEQQTVSIAKAGITTTLNARAAVLAAANPLYGRYNVKKSISENVDLPNSLLSRFDLLFLILDRASLDADLALSKHVLHVHKYRKKPDQEQQPLEPIVIKQYIAAARSIEPTIPKQLANYVVEAYVSLRAQDGGAGNGNNNQRGAVASRVNDQAAMTARQLLSIMRLSQALARLRLANEVAMQDIDEAIRLTHASKASLFETTTNRPNEDSITQVYNTLRDLCSKSGTEGVSFSVALNAVLLKGLTERQLLECIEEYEDLGVLSLNDDKTLITIF